MADRVATDHDCRRCGIVLMGKTDRARGEHVTCPTVGPHEPPRSDFMTELHNTIRERGTIGVAEWRGLQTQPSPQHKEDEP